MHAVIDHAPYGIIVIDDDCLIRSFNPAARRIFGYTESEVIGRPFSTLIAECPEAGDPDAMHRCLSSGQPSPDGWEAEGIRKDATVFPLHISFGETQMDGTRHFIGFVQDISERKRQEQELVRLASRDPLTGLANLYTLLAQMNDMADRAFGLFLLDIARFTAINEVLSHASGDRVLREVGMRLASLESEHQCRVSRIGGDVFAVCWPDLSTPKSYFAAVTHMQSLLAEPIQLADYAIDIEASIGIDAHPSRTDDEPEDILRRAEVALAASKRSHSGYAFYDPDMERYGVEHLSLLGELNRAMEEGELVLFYQPKADMHDGMVCGVEALVRWQHPEKGFMSPDLFIPMLENTSLIHAFTAWLIHEAIRHAAGWQARGLDLTVSINIAARNIMNPDIVQQIESGLQRRGLPPRKLMLEITETGLMADPVAAKRILKQLHQLGIGLSIDDFGTGYSSLAYLKDLPVNELKIDRVFVHQMLDSAKDANIVQATIHLAHSLGLEVVAEGIESDAIWQRLAAYGCDKAQGYHLSKPMPFEAVEAWMEGYGPDIAPPRPEGVRLVQYSHR